MRSCTGWPSGTWIDEPRRTAPDGSNFQLQHWTHAFRLRAGVWRRRLAGRPRSRPAVRSSPIRCWPYAAATIAGRGCRRWGRCCTSSPADSVQLGALKAAGNPLTAGSARPVDAGAVALRLVETTGSGTSVAVGSDARHGARDCGRPTCWKSRWRDPGAQAIGRHCTATRWPPCWPGSRCPSWLTEPTRRWPRCRGRPTALRAILAAQPRPRAARWVAGRRPPAPARAGRRAGQRGGVAPHRGQRLHRCRAGGHGDRWCVPTAGRPTPPSCRSRCAAASTRRPTSWCRSRRTRNPGGIRSGRSCASPGRRPAAWRQVVEDVCVRRGRRGVPRTSWSTSSTGQAKSSWRPATRPGSTVTVGSARPRRLVAGGAPDQPVGHLGVDRSGRAGRRPARRRHGRTGLRGDPTGVAGARPVVGPGPGRLRRADWSTRPRCG